MLPSTAAAMNNARAARRRQNQGQQVQALQEEQRARESG